MPRTAITIGPRDHGRHMSLEDFDRAEGRMGYGYELSRGVVTVTEVPNPRHLAQVIAIRRQLMTYDLAHPGRIYGILSGSECKILIAELESERHPDPALYKTPPPPENVWTTWVPEIVIEVVSAESAHRDYVEKAEEYLAFGVQEYWIINAERQEMLVLRRSGRRWTERAVRPPQLYRPRLLPGLEFDCAAVFGGADASGR